MSPQKCLSITATSLGYDSEIRRETNREFLESLERWIICSCDQTLFYQYNLLSVFQIVAYRSVRIWLHPSWIYKMTPSYQICKRLFKKASSLTEMVGIFLSSLCSLGKTFPGFMLCKSNVLSNQSNVCFLKFIKNFFRLKMKISTLCFVRC